MGIESYLTPYPTRPNFQEGSNLVGVLVETVDDSQNTPQIILDADYVEAWNEVARNSGEETGEISLVEPNILAAGSNTYELTSDYAAGLFSLLAANRDRPLMKPELLSCGFDEGQLELALRELAGVRTDKGELLIDVKIDKEAKSFSVQISPTCVIDITKAAVITEFEYVDVGRDEASFIGALGEFLNGQKNSMPVFAEGYRPRFGVETAIRRLITQEFNNGLRDFKVRLEMLNRYRAPGSGITRDAQGKSMPVTLPGWTVKPENYSLPDEDDESSQVS